MFSSNYNLHFNNFAKVARSARLIGPGASWPGWTSHTGQPAGATSPCWPPGNLEFRRASWFILRPPGGPRVSKTHKKFEARERAISFYFYLSRVKRSPYLAGHFGFEPRACVHACVRASELCPNNFLTHI